MKNLGLCEKACTGQSVYGHVLNREILPLRTFALIVSAHPYCARKFTCHVIHRARALILNWITIGQMTIVIALLGFNDLGHSVTPIFLFRNGFYLQLSSMWEVKKISQFLSTGNGILPSCGSKARETMVAKCELDSLTNLISWLNSLNRST